MNITDYVAKHAAVKPTADIVERWEARIVGNGWHVRGRAGAEAYIGKYLKAAKAPKAVGFARIAEIKGCPEVASRFWEEALFLETGLRANCADTGGGTTGGEGSVIASAVRESFGQLPQLLVLVDRATAQNLVDDPAWGAQEKKDGRRALIRVRDGRVSGGNKKGLVSTVPLSVVDELSVVGDAMFDGEEIDGTFHAFDLLSHNGEDLRGYPFAERDSRLARVIEALPKRDAVKLVPLHVGGEEKRALVETLESNGAEGFVLKRLSSSYEAGDAHGSQWKHQFRALSSFIVGQRNGAKESVQISAMRADGTLRDMGNLTVRTSIPAPGSIVEVEYLYCHPGPSGKLHQPVFKGVRDDAAAEDCRVEKIKIKGSAATADDEE